MRESDKTAMNNIEDKEKHQTMGEYIGDAAVTTKIKSKFLAQKGLGSLDIKVVTVDGTVTLMGDVNDLSQVSLAEKTAREVEGVRYVDNKLQAMN